MDHMIQFLVFKTQAKDYFKATQPERRDKMPYVDGYDNGHAVWNRTKGFIQKPVQIKGEVNIETINSEFIEKRNVQVGDIMPWSAFKITERKV
ncbi:MAG TPA: hypothetical protein DEB05_02905 [Firmicutes bacterium]|nr:hypothetical protein [Bacillota bacterium]